MSSGTTCGGPLGRVVAERDVLVFSEFGLGLPGSCDSTILVHLDLALLIEIGVHFCSCCMGSLLLLEPG